MISRHWKGVARPEKADTYIDHLRKDTFPQLSKIRGFKGASILRRIVRRGVEFLIVTEWESLDAVREFAGEKPEVAVVPPVVQAMMIAYDKKCRHYEVVEKTDVRR